MNEWSSNVHQSNWNIHKVFIRPIVISFKDGSRTLDFPLPLLISQFLVCVCVCFFLRALSLFYTRLCCVYILVWYDTDRPKWVWVEWEFFVEWTRAIVIWKSEPSDRGREDFSFYLTNIRMHTLCTGRAILLLELDVQSIWSVWQKGNLVDSVRI